MAPAATAAAGGTSSVTGASGRPTEPLPLRPMAHRDVAAEDVGRHEAGHVHRVFRAAVLRRVAQFGLFEIEHRGPFLDGHGDHVDAFFHARPAHGLRPSTRPDSGANSSFRAIRSAPG